MWYHAPFKADEWMLYDIVSPRLESARGLAIGSLYSRDTGELCVTCVQEGLLCLARTSAARGARPGFTVVFNQCLTNKAMLVLRDELNLL